MLQIDVTQDDIDFGEPHKPCDCPIALAIDRQWPGSLPYVNADGISLTIDGVEYDYYMPDIAVSFMDAFDDGDPVRPFSFTIDD